MRRRLRESASGRKRQKRERQGKSEEAREQRVRGRAARTAEVVRAAKAVQLSKRAGQDSNQLDSFRAGIRRREKNPLDLVNQGKALRGALTMAQCESSVFFPD